MSFPQWHTLALRNVLTRRLMLATHEAMSTAGRIGGSNEPMTAKQAAEYLGVTYKHYLEMRDEWGIRTYRKGRGVMTRKRELDAYMERGGSSATSDHRKKNPPCPGEGTEDS
jgi:excisionase family DNA binding protein